MAPFLPVIGISRSQNVRIGRSPNAATVADFGQFNSTIPGRDAQTGTFNVPTYIDLGDPFHRRDLQRHSALGAVVTVGVPSATVTSDLFWATRPTLTGAASPATVGTTGVLQSRIFGATSAGTQVATNLAAGASITVPTPVGATRVDTVYVTAAGIYGVVRGVEGGAAPLAPANTTALGTLSITTGGVVTPTANGPTT